MCTLIAISSTTAAAATTPTTSHPEMPTRVAYSSDASSGTPSSAPLASTAAANTTHRARGRRASGTAIPASAKAISSHPPAAAICDSGSSTGSPRWPSTARVPAP